MRILSNLSWLDYFIMPSAMNRSCIAKIFCYLAPLPRSCFLLYFGAFASGGWKGVLTLYMILLYLHYYVSTIEVNGSE